MDCREAYKYSFANKKMLENDNRCGCFYCGKVFSPDVIYEWIEDMPDLTALCPYCGVDSVIGESVGYPLTKEALDKMYEIWFVQKELKQ